MILPTIIAVVLFLVGVLFLLAIIGGSRCPNCDRHLDDEEKCIKCGEEKKP